MSKPATAPFGQSLGIAMDAFKTESLPVYLSTVARLLLLREPLAVDFLDGGQVRAVGARTDLVLPCLDQDVRKRLSLNGRSDATSHVGPSFADQIGQLSDRNHALARETYYATDIDQALSDLVLLAALLYELGKSLIEERELV